MLDYTDLPAGFSYPALFVRVVELGLTNLEPWRFLEDEFLRGRHLGLIDRYPSRRLVPFARRQDNDDVACWDLAEGGIVIIHDFASPGYELRARLPNFSAWLRMAIDDLIEFSPED
jgi:hypothetical protein